jgi:signal transduction histidine kinase
VVVAAIRDITELKQLEAERAAIRVREEAARRDAQAAARVRQAFMAAATHDLGNPLMAIRVQAELLEELAGELAPSQAAEQVLSGAQRIVATSSRMAGILRELLDVARLQTGQQLVLERRPTDLAALARRVIADRQQATQHHVLRLRVEGEDHALVGSWDAGRLERVLDNLLDNAIKYSPRGGEVAVSVMPQDTVVVLAVADHGLGIPAADLPHVFEWFRRGSNVADSAPGSGLGLAGARQIVEQHGGTLSVDSREGVGTTFMLRLPRAPA